MKNQIEKGSQTMKKLGEKKLNIPTRFYSSETNTSLKKFFYIRNAINESETDFFPLPNGFD